MEKIKGRLFHNNFTIIKFGLVGLWNTLVGYSVFWGLDTLFSHLLETKYVAYMSAMILSQVVGTVNAFIFHKYVTFNSKTAGKNMIYEFFRFCLTYAFTFFLSLILLPIFVEVFHHTPKMSAAVIIVICAAISYMGHLKFSFRVKGSIEQSDVIKKF